MLNYGITFAGPMTCFKIRYKKLLKIDAEAISQVFSEAVSLEVTKKGYYIFTGALTSSLYAEFSNMIEDAKLQYQLIDVQAKIAQRKAAKDFFYEVDDLPF
jgi:hypothetical protein